MITPQYTYDKSGNKIGVFLSIEDWEQLEKIPAVEELSESGAGTPGWHIDLVRNTLKNVENGNEELLSWEESKKQFKL